ncbi:T9SS type A sorting domain-containing protein [Flammeovirga pacifica]|uniref:Secretion system C-terminal sorting domain-containing protein n=1 Tax=Flammeovirga pacifica TaxID=915059 RepID=A0A1S1Z2M0_FLAPC|nr:T9SS type A sorting domain-containing protein [Flammeovirga pacifica]OHX67491.1 hypothetical protein NH26_14620 [Flammeovirga pacifica]
MNKLTLLFLFICITNSFSQTHGVIGDDLGVYCGKVKFRPPSFLKSSFIGGNYTFEVWARDPKYIINANKEDDFLNIEDDGWVSVFTQVVPGNASVIETDELIGADTKYLGKQLRIKVKRSSFESQYMYFYILPNLLEDNFSISTAAIDECKGRYIDLTLTNLSYKNKELNLIVYPKNDNGNWYTIDNSKVPKVQAVSIYSDVIKFNDTDEPIVNDQNKNLEIVKIGNKIRLYFNGDEDQGFFVQITETSGDTEQFVTYSQYLEDFISINSLQSSCPTQFEINFNGITKEVLSVEGVQINPGNPSFYNHTESTYYGISSINFTASGGYYGNTNSGYRDISQDISIDKKDPEEYRSEHTIEDIIISTNCDPRETSTFNINLTSPDAPTFTVEGINIDNSNPSGTINVSNLSIDDNNTDGYSYTYKLFENNVSDPISELTDVAYGIDLSFENLLDGDYYVKLFVTNNTTQNSFWVENKDIDNNRVIYNIDNIRGPSIYNISLGRTIPHISSNSLSVSYDVPFSIFVSGQNVIPDEGITVTLIDDDGNEISQNFSASDFGVNNELLVTFNDVNVGVYDGNALNYSVQITESINDVVTYSQTQTISLQEAAPVIISDNGTDPLYTETHYSMGNIPNELAKFSLNIQGDQDLTYYIYKSYINRDGDIIWEPLPESVNIQPSGNNIDISSLYPDFEYRLLITDRLYPNDTDKNTIVSALDELGKDEYAGQCWVSSSESFSVVQAAVGDLSLSSQQALTDDFQIICNGGNVSLSSTITSTIDGYQPPYYYIGSEAPTQVDQFERINTLTDPLSFDTEERGNYKTFPAGNYSIYILEKPVYDLLSTNDLRGFYSATSFVLNEPEIIGITLSINEEYRSESDQIFHVSRFDGTDGKVEATVIGGQPPYALTLQDENSSDNYFQSDIATSYEYSGLKGSDYTINTLSDNLGCTASSTVNSVTLSKPNPLQIDQFESVHNYGGLGYDISEYQGNDGAISISVSEGIENYTAYLYHKNEGETQYTLVNTSATPFSDIEVEEFTGLEKGYYKVVVVDKYFNQTLPTQFSNLSTIVTDNSSISGDIVISEDIELVEPEELIVTIESLENYQTHPDSSAYHVQCNFGNKAKNGIAYFNISGGIPLTHPVPTDGQYYQFTFNRGAESVTINVDVTKNAENKWEVVSNVNQIHAGILEITVEDSQNTIAETNTTLIPPHAIEVAFLKPKAPDCIDANNGTIKMEIKGGIPVAVGQSYTLTFGNDIRIYEDLEDYNEAEGSKTFTLKDAYSCPCEIIDDTQTEYVETFYEIDQLNTIQTFNQAAVDEINLDPIVRDQWSGPTTFMYYLSDYFPFSIEVQSDSTSCFEAEDGFFTISNFYGGAGELYSLEVRKGIQLIQVEENISATDQIVINNLEAGTYTLSLKDALCTNYRNIDTVFVTRYVGPTGETASSDQFAYGQAAIREPDPLIANITPIQTSCYGTPSGELSMNITGGHLPYTITVYVENTANLGGYDSLVYSQTVDSHDVIVDQLFGDKKYRVHISDLMSCEVETRYENALEKFDDNLKYYGVYYVEERPSIILPLVSNIGALDQSCENILDGSLWFNTLGNSSGTLFRWIDSKGNLTAELSVTNPNSIEKLEWQSLPSGNYTLQFRESESCDWKTTTRVKNIEILPALTLEIDKVLHVSNDNYTVFLNANTIKGSLRIDKKQADGSWLNIQSLTVNHEAIFLENLSEGEYQFTLYYDGIPECSSDIKILDTNTADIVEFAAIVNTKDPSCGNTPNGTASFELINRIAADIRNISWKDENNNILGTTSSINNLLDGNYILELEDNNGIKVQSSFTLASPDDLSIINELALAPNCVDGMDGQVILQVLGGASENYNFNWVDINTLRSVSNEKILTNVPSGTYDVTIADSDNPTCTTSTTVEIPEAKTLFVDNIVISNPTFNGVSNGSISISPRGGVGPYIVFWKDQQQYGNTLENLSIGSYPVLITDKNNCQKDTIINIDQQPELLAVTILNKEDEACYGARNGSVEIEITGGTAPYFIEWNNNQRGNTLSGVSEGTYTAKVTDVSGFSSSFDISIGGNTPMVITLNQIIHPSCVGSADGSMILDITGGTGDYQFDLGAEVKISNEGSIYTISGFESGRYDVNITDEKGCSASIYDNRFIDPDPIVITDFIVTEPLCNGGADGSIELIVKGGSGNYNFVWEGYTSNQSKLENISSGIYKVTITDEDKGCLVEESFFLSEVSQLSASIVNPKNPSCVGESGGSINVMVTGGTAPYTYLWSDGQTTSTATNLEAGNYSVTITDKNQCSISLDHTIIDPQPIQINVPNLQELIEICEGTTFSLNAGSEWSKVEWTSDRGLYSEESEMLFTSPGNYQLKVTNTLGCQESVSFEVVTRDDLLNANYVIESSPEHGIDTYHIIDLSWPIPDNIEWSIEPKVAIIDSSDHELEIRFIEKGTHTITLRAMLSGCLAEIQREIEVTTSTNGRLVIFDPKQQPDQQEVEVVSMDVYPNPSNGHLNINIEFIETMDAVLTLITLGDNKKIWEENLRNKSNYSMIYNNTKLPTGLYLLQLTTNNTVHVVKVMIMK